MHFSQVMQQFGANKPDTMPMDVTASAGVLGNSLLKFISNGVTYHDAALVFGEHPKMPFIKIVNIANSVSSNGIIMQQ